MQSVVIKLSVTVNGADKIGLLHNNPAPTCYSERAIVDLPSEPGKYDICLKADADSGRKELFINNNLTMEKSYAPTELRGVYIVFKNADIILEDVKIIKA